MGNVYEEKIKELRIEERLEQIAEELREMADYEATSIQINCSYSNNCGSTFEPSVFLLKRKPDGDLQLIERCINAPGAMMGAFDQIRDIIKTAT